MAITSKDISAAYKRIEPYIVNTPLMRMSEDFALGNGSLYAKLENRQHTGSFKARGAMNIIFSLVEQGFKGRVITASTGNHGLGVARALSFTDLHGTIFVPEDVSDAKLKKLQAFNTTIEFVYGGPLQTELTAKEYARQQNAAWISPYNDPDIIAGQGTIGLELTTALPEIAAVYITIGGGGLASGVATWINEISPKTEIIGCLPIRSPEMKLSVDAGHIVHLGSSESTLSDGSAGGCEDDSITFPICKRLIDRFILIEEEEIANVIRRLYQGTGERIEGSAGVALAAVEKDRSKYHGETVVAILCGGNIEDSLFERIVQGHFTGL